MFIRIIAISIILTQTACVPVFDFSTNEKLTFNFAPPSQQPMGYADLMCCYDCVV